jgi:murein DD-endopeptidase MepM/ murein hydrolase activator NlpD
MRSRVLLVLAVAVGGPAGAAEPLFRPFFQGPVEGGVRLAPDEMSEARRREILDAVAHNVALLRLHGRIAPPTEGGPPLQEPLRPANGLSDIGYHGQSPFVDHDPAFPGSLLDFDCAERTYDNTSGYNHAGTDLLLWPFPWKKVAESKVEVVAAAGGTLVYKEDGHPDQSCVNVELPWNAVGVMHPDGTLALYGHMKTGTVTPKPLGAAVQPGEVLGVVASSGNSSWPHLHFELRDPSFEVVDPWAGPCNDTVDDSLWAVQPPHYDSAINKLTTGFPAPNALPPCPTIETPNEKKDFQPGNTIYFTIYHRDLLYFQPNFIEIRDPNGLLYAGTTYQKQPPNPLYDLSYVYFSLTLGNPVPTGTWTYRVTFEGKVYEQLFNVGTAPAGRVPDRHSEGEPLRVAKLPASGAIRLAWGDSCRSSDSSFAIYEGTLGASPFYNHLKKVCDTAGAKTWTFAAPSDGDLYWIVAPRNAQREGSYGTDSSRNERPAPQNVLQRCLPQSIACPVP